MISKGQGLWYETKGSYIELKGSEYSTVKLFKDEFHFET